MKHEEKHCLRQIKNILIIRNGALGDFILTLPVIEGLKKVFPAARIKLIASPSLLPLAIKHVDRFIPNDATGLYRLYGDDNNLPKNIQDILSGVDLVVSYSVRQDESFINNLKKIGISWVIHGGFSPEEKLCRSASDRLLFPLQQAGIPIDYEPPRITPSPLERESAQRLLRSLLNVENSCHPLVAIHPGSGSAKKCWPSEKFAALIPWAIIHRGARVLLISGPADKTCGEEVKAALGGCTPAIIEDLPLNHLAAVLEQCAAYVGNDSGITHLAAAVGVPTLALFGPTNRRIWGPQNKNAKCLQGIYPCSPCSSEQMARCAHPACLEALPVATVKRELASLLSQGDCVGPVVETNRCVKEMNNYV